MDFTEIYKQSSGIVAFSPGAHFVLTAVQDRVVIRRADTFQITRTWLSSSDAQSSQVSSRSQGSAKSQPVQPDAWITHASWSNDSEYLLAACAKRGVVNIFKLRDESWNARVNVGTESLVKAEWAPDGTCTYIQYPLHPDRGYGFRPDGRYLIIAERHKSKDTLGVYDASELYRLVRHFPLPTSTLASLSISPNGDYVAIWEGPMEFRVYILNLSGNTVGSFTPDLDPGYGIRSVVWHPSGFFLLVAGWDDKIHILERLTWGPVALLELQSRIGNPVIVWREPSDWLEKTQGRGFLSYERLQPPHSIAVGRPDFSKGNPKSGVVQLSFNVSGTLLLARFESAPTAVFLYAFPSASDHDVPTRPEASVSLAPKLKSVLIHTNPVVAARWNPVRKGSLAISCGTGSIYLWSDEWVGDDATGESEEVAECVGIPARQFNAQDIRWAPDGKGLILLDKEAFCCAFEVEDEEQPV
ncbi:unnamed protein product [Somion occarium]|uniref:WD repeat-containing protein 8 n=1 Tax=Somion occarium TaxID=3059160 RepID=A0ABP1CI12_9APHY